MKYNIPGFPWLRDNFVLKSRNKPTGLKPDTLVPAAVIVLTRTKSGRVDGKVSLIPRVGQTVIEQITLSVITKPQLFHRTESKVIECHIAGK